LDWRRAIRRAIAIAKRPGPLVVRKLAAIQFLSTAPRPIKFDPKVGYCLIAPGVIQTVRKAAEAAERILAEHRELLSRDKSYMVKFTKHIDLGPVRDITDVAFDPSVLAIASDYLGGVPVLKDLSVWWSRPSEKAREAQLFHIDSIPDTRSLRYLINLTDVDAYNGPLHLLPANLSLDLIREMGYLGGVIHDDMILSRYGSAALVRSIGPVGSGVALDTGRCFHYGSRNIRERRLMLSLSYSSCYLQEPFDASKIARGRAPLSPLEKLVLAA
jgi:hypothetical protein